MSIRQQEILDIIFPLLWNQGKSSVAGDGHQCQYLAGDGSKCAVGFLIRKENYTTSLEGNGIGSLKVVHAVEKSLRGRLSDTSFKFLREMQIIHDDLRPAITNVNGVPISKNEWRKRFTAAVTDICEQFDVTLPEFVISAKPVVDYSPQITYKPMPVKFDGFLV